MVRISLSVPLEEGAQVEQGLGEIAAFANQQRYQQAAYSAIAIDEWVDGLDLIMNDRQMNQKGQVRWRMNEVFEFI